MDNNKREGKIMNIQFKCPQCGQMVEADESAIGQTASCPYCDKRIIVPKERIQKRSTTAENVDVPLRKPISMNAALSAWLSCLNVKSLALFSAICVLIIIIQSVMLIVLFAQRTTVNNSGHMANSILNANSNQTETPSEQFLKYIEQGEVSYVKEVLKQNPALDVNRPRAAGNKTALYIACEKGYADIAKFLLGKKADASICDTEKAISSTRYSPLTVAAKNGHLAVVKVLLSSGIDIEARDDGNRTALYAAAAGNKPDVVRFLCESNAKVNILARHNSWSPLSAAIHEGYVEVVKTLLKYGKGIDLEMRIAGKTVLYNAVKANRPDIVRLLCESNAKVNVFCNDSDTPLTIAAKEGFIEVIRVLLKYGKGIDLEKRCHCWYSAPPLYHAAIKGHVDAIAVLCEAGADLSARDGKFGNTPLEAASTQGYEDAVKVLKKYEEERARQKEGRIALKDGRKIEDLRKAAEQGDPKAQFDLAFCYAGGDGVEQSKTEVAKWIRKSAEQGYSEAQCTLGILYANGVGVSADKSEAIKWIRKAAEQNHPLALCNLAQGYVAGDGVPQDLSEAVRLYRKSAELGLAEAQFQLGVVYANGLCVAQDWCEAANWYRKAAEQGHSKAQLALGLCYQTGLGVNKNVVEASKWISESKKNPQLQEQVQDAVNFLKQFQ